MDLLERDNKQPFIHGNLQGSIFVQVKFVYFFVFIVIYFGVRKRVRRGYLIGKEVAWIV